MKIMDSHLFSPFLLRRHLPRAADRERAKPPDQSSPTGTLAVYQFPEVKSHDQEPTVA